MEKFIEARDGNGAIFYVNPAHVIFVNQENGMMWLDNGKILTMNATLLKGSCTIEDTGGSTRPLRSAWHSVKDSLPKEGDMVIVYAKGNVIFVSQNFGGKMLPNVTHWMSIPEPPKNADSFA